MTLMSIVHVKKYKTAGGGISELEERVYKPSLGQTSWNLPRAMVNITKLQCS